MSAVQDDRDYEKILGYARELFRQFRIAKPDLDKVSWDDTLSPDPVLVKYGEVKLHRHMKGRLAPEDWGLLLAPSIVYNYILYPNPSRGALVRFMLPQTVAVLLMTYLLLQIFKITDTAYELLLFLILGYTAFTAVVLASWTNWFSRSLIFASDRRAAEIVGGEALVLAMTKYRDAESASRPFLKRKGFRPSLNQRIERLQSQSGLTHSK